MSRTPLEAFNRFLELTPDIGSVYRNDPEDYEDLLDAFLQNPSQHKRHVAMISQAAMAARLAKMLPLVRFTQKFILSSNRSPQLINQLTELKDELTASAQPGLFTYDILPSRLAETPKEWASEYQLHLVELRVAIRPDHGFLPSSVSLDVTLGLDSYRFTDCFPSTEFEEIGEYEVELTDEAKFVRGMKANAEISGKADVHSIGFSGGGGGSVEKNKTTTEKSARSFKYPAKIQKIVSSAVGTRAQWTLLRAGDDFPTGGLTFYVSVMADRAGRSCPIEGKLSVDLEGWGVVSIPIEGNMEFSAREEPSTEPTSD